jgi:hypothetical protein
MTHQGSASDTKIDDIQLIEKADKAHLTVLLSGNSLDLAAASSILRAEFPKAYIDIDAQRHLRVVISHPLSDENAPSAADIVEKIFDKTQCDLGIQFRPEAHKHGELRRSDPEFTKHYVKTEDYMDGPGIMVEPEQPKFYTADVIISLEREEPYSLRERTVMDVVERKLKQQPLDANMAYYFYTRSNNGTKLSVSHLQEMNKTKKEALQLATVIMGHCKQKLGVPSADIKLTAIDGNVLATSEEERPDYLPPEPVVFTLFGTEDALERAQHNLKSDIGMEMELVPSKRGRPAQLHISKPAQTGAEVMDILGKIHTATGCELPIRLQHATSREDPDPPQQGPSLFQPAVLLWFEDADARYSELMIQTVTRYVSSMVKGKQELQFPIVNGADGDVYDLNQPVALIHEKTFKAAGNDSSKALEDAEGEAVIMMNALKPLIEFKTPAAKGRAA